MLAVSVIIPAFNEEKFLGNCLLSLKEQDFKDFEIIVVDNNSTDKTGEIAKKFGVILVSEKKQGVAFARNKGAKIAKGEILAFTDADTILPKNWLSRIKEEFEKDKELIAFGGSCEFYSGPISARLASKFLLKPFLILDKFFSGGFNLMGCNMAIKREAFLKVGGFNEKLKLNEDVEISYRLRKMGKVKFDPNFKVKTSGRRFRHGLIFGIINYAPATIFRWFFKRFDKFQIFPAQRKEESLVGNFSFLFSLFLLIFLFFHFLNPEVAIAKNLVKKEINKLVFTERKIKIKIENEFGKVKNLPHLRQKVKLRHF
jgi:glycosyltransferase involved in cell wall biosynthesis